MNQTTEMFLKSAHNHMFEGDKYMKNKNLKKAEPDLALSEYKKAGKDYKSCSLFACASAAFEFAAEAAIISKLMMSIAVNYRDAAECCELSINLGAKKSLLPDNAPKNITSCSGGDLNEDLVDMYKTKKEKPAKVKYCPIKDKLICEDRFEKESEVFEDFYNEKKVGSCRQRCFELYKLAAVHFGLAGQFVDLADMYARATGYAPDFESYQHCAGECVSTLINENKPMQAFLTSIEFCERLALESAHLRSLVYSKKALKEELLVTKSCGISNNHISAAEENLTKEELLKRSDFYQKAAADAANLCRGCLNATKNPEQINKAAFMSVIIALISGDVVEADSCFSYFADFSSQLAEMAEDLIDAIRARSQERLTAAKKKSGKYFLSANALKIIQSFDIDAISKAIDGFSDEDLEDTSNKAINEFNDNNLEDTPKKASATVSITNPTLLSNNNTQSINNNGPKKVKKPVEKRRF